MISFIVLAISRLLLRPAAERLMSADERNARALRPSRSAKDAGRRSARPPPPPRRTRRSRRCACAATIIGLLFLASILVTLLWRGFGGLSLTVFTRITLPPGSHGGLLNAIVGSLIQTALGDRRSARRSGCWSAPISPSIRAARRFGNAVRFVSDVLLSAPSILIGLFVYVLVVRPVGGFSGIAGASRSR